MKICISMILILTFCVLGFAQQNIDSNYNVYKDDKYPFSLFYPKDWTQLQPSHAQTRFKIAKEDGLYYTDFNINAVYVEESKDVSAGEAVKFLGDNPKIVDSLIRQGNPTSKLISSGKTYLSNREAFFIKSEATFRTFDQAKELTIYQIITRYQGITYTLTFRALKKEFDDNFLTFKLIASSFVIRPTPPPKVKSTNKTLKRN